MKLGIVDNVEDLEKSQWVKYDAEGYGDTEDPVEFLIRPWTRTTQAKVEKRAKAAGRLTDADIPSGSGNEKSEKYTRTLADYLLEDWKNVVSTSTSEELPCDSRTKMFLFENIDVAVWILEQAKKLNVRQIGDEEKKAGS